MKPGAKLIDVGINKTAGSNVLVGDIEFDKVSIFVIFRLKNELVSLLQCLGVLDH